MGTRSRIRCRGGRTRDVCLCPVAGNAYLTMQRAATLFPRPAPSIVVSASLFTMPNAMVMEADKDVKANIDKFMAKQPAGPVKIEWAPCSNPGFQNCPAVAQTPNNTIKN